jgi:predicted ATP-grasp superfamily ATP-dependent carboligase
MSALRVIVTDGESRAALATVRSLGSAGYEVHVVSSGRTSLAGASRYAAAEHCVADAASSPRLWAKDVEQLALDVGVDLILPITEVSIGTVHEMGMARRCRVVCPEPSAYAEAVDKHALMMRAAAMGIPVPRSFLIPDPSTRIELPPQIEFPIVLKARRSRFLVDGRWVAGDVRVIRDVEELAAVAEEPGFQSGALVQEFVPGHGEAIFVLAQEGRTLVSFSHRRIREKPPTGGVSVMRESIDPDPELLAHSERLLAELGWTGVAMVEFRRRPGGPGVLMEINPRLWGSLQLAIDAGVDFPSLWLSLEQGEQVMPAPARVGVRSRWLLGDFDHLLISLRRRSMREATGRRSSQVVRDFLQGFFDGSRMEVLRRDDWRPFVHELRTWCGW